MDDLKMKVLKALYCCRVLDVQHWPKCEKCPYMDSELGTCRNLNQMHEDAWNVLMAQEPLTDASISSAIECLLHPQDADDSDMTKAIDTAVRAMKLLKAREPRVMTLEEVKKAEVCWLEQCGYEPFATLEAGTWNPERYGKSYRCWNHMPTEEQREAVKWDAAD